MATPTYIYTDTIDTGSASLNDAASQGAIVHYSDLVQAGLAAPHRGAYAFRIILQSGITTPSTLIVTDKHRGDETRFYRWHMWIGDDVFDAASNVTIPIFSLAKVTPSVVIYQVGFTVDIASRELRWAIGQTSPSSVGGGTIPTREWLCVELRAHWDASGSTGFLELYVTRDGHEPGATSSGAIHSISGLTNTSDGFSFQVVGTAQKPTDAVGTFLYSDYIIDDVRIWPTKDRYSDTKIFVRDEHAFVGAGTVNHFSLASSNAADNVVNLYDTDTAQTHQSLKRASLANIAANETKTYDGPPIRFNRGCFVEFTGTDNPQVTIGIESATGWFSGGNIARFGHARKLAS